MIHIRPAGAADARQMAELLSEIITIGGTTAMTEPVDRDTVVLWMARDAARAAWHVAETGSGEVVGFQWVAPHPKLPDDACEIATFVRHGRHGLGVGSRLFEATKNTARSLGYRWINATIRADNDSGLTYYQSRGFQQWAREANVSLASGHRIDRLSKRYDL